jgi:hypothetical protein
MTVLGAVVFGGFLALGVLWLLVTAPDSDIDQAWHQAQWTGARGFSERGIQFSGPD